ncbi:MAG: hypothetical protein IJI71_08360 [Clostridia bacterium]|nr:hypothetical protein [Clostridia bacterium]
MNRKHTSSRMREQKLNRRLMIAFAVVVLLGVVAQITMMVQLSNQSKQTFAARTEARDLASRIDNLNHSLEQFHNRDRITARAQALGMQLPDDTQLRMVNLSGLSYGTTAQSAENTGAGELD